VDEGQRENELKLSLSSLSLLSLSKVYQVVAISARVRE
jgi:hypothetical protein